MQRTPTHDPSEASVIRFVRIGNQISLEEDEFAFFDTVRDQWVEFDDRQIFNSLQDLAEAIQSTEYFDEEFVQERGERCMRLAKSANPPVRTTEGIDGRSQPG